MQQWFTANNLAEIPSPALLVYPDRIRENIRRMITIAGSPEKLRPHVKTHKMSEIVRLQVKEGITRFKCSTIIEAGMVADAGGKDILLAMQPVGIQIDRFFQLKKKYAGVNFSAIVDDFEIFSKLASKALEEKTRVNLWVDINNGMDRTGIKPGHDALRLYHEIANHPHCTLRG
ncbi:MAG: alanine racemase, partial [Bacteroidales bacterium]|nr:alanine racemase [Bacteroidales bacterium]